MSNAVSKSDLSQPASWTLCPICNQIPFEDIFHPSGVQSSINHELGKITLIRKKASSCRFCWFVIQIHDRVLSSFFARNHRLKTRSKETVYLVPCSPSKPWHEIIGVEALHRKVHTAWIQYGIQTGPHVTEPCVCISPMQSLVSGAITKPISEPVLANSSQGVSYPRRRNALEAASGSINYELIRTWVDLCRNKHIALCGESTTFKRQLLKVKLIDVQQRQVVTIEGDVRYVALSYVRGSFLGEDASAVHAPLQASSESSSGVSRVALPKELPKTVENALTFVKDIGEKYLWVDLFCIDQENEEEVQAQIEQMDLVYECAYLTLIALDGRNYDAGLAGIGRPLQQTYQPTIDTPHGSFMATFIESVWENQGNAPWDFRSWTFQEGLLSRRSLIFDKRHILMRCWEEIFHDCMAVDLSVSRVPILQSDEFFWENGWGLNLYENVFTFSAFDTLITNYSRRELSLQSDALNACKGALSQMTRHTGVGFIWGLPQVDIARALLWKPHQYYSVVRRPEFPSWSWLGWKGRTEYSYWLNEMDDYDGGEKAPNPPRPEVDHSSRDSTGRELVTRNDKAFVVIKGMSEASHLLKVSSTIARFGLKLVRKNGTAVKKLQPDSKQSRIAVGDHWTLLSKEGKPLKNMIGEDATFEETDHFFHVHPQVSQQLTDLGGYGEFLFVRYWRYIRDHHASNNWLADMVSALLIMRLSDGSAWRVASVVMDLEDWVAADPHPATVTLT